MRRGWGFNFLLALKSLWYILLLYLSSSVILQKGNQCWIFIGRTDAESETPILWPPDVKNWFICKDRDAGKDWRQEEKGTREDEMVGWHHWLNGHEFEEALGVGDGPDGLWSMGQQRVRHDWRTELIWSLSSVLGMWSRITKTILREVTSWNRSVQCLSVFSQFHFISSCLKPSSSNHFISYNWTQTQFSYETYIEIFMLWNPYCSSCKPHSLEHTSFIQVYDLSCVYHASLVRLRV